MGRRPAGTASAAGTAGAPPASPHLLVKRHWPRRMLVAANVGVLICLVVAASAYGYVQWRFSQISRIAVQGLDPTGKGGQSPPGAEPPMTILVVGSDTRALGKGASASFGSASEVTGQRSDTIMLVRVVPATDSIALLSVPRDLLVPITGLGTTRINAAFGGGPNLLVQTIEQDLGIEVNHFAVVNFVTFAQIANAVGGVYQYFPTPARDAYSNLVVTHAGCVLLKGSQALAFVRSREYQYYLDGTWQYQLVPESDLARIQRQQDFIKLALKKAEEVAVTNPIALNDVVSGITSSLTVDSGFSTSSLINLALSMRHLDVAGIPNWTYPTVNSTSVPGALDAVPTQDQQVVDQFLSYGQPRPATTAATSAPAPSATKVKVLNGSGVAGQAATAAAALERDGYMVSSAGDASNFSYVQSVVEYGPGGLPAAKALQGRVPGGAALLQVSGLAPDALVLITGQSYTGTSATAALKLNRPATMSARPQAAVLAAELTGPTKAAPKATALPALSADVSPAQGTVPPVSADSSSYYEGRYIPPGLLPGQVPPTCPS